MPRVTKKKIGAFDYGYSYIIIINYILNSSKLVLKSPKRTWLLANTSSIVSYTSTQPEAVPNFDDFWNNWVAFRDTCSHLKHNNPELSAIRMFHYIHF